MGCAEGFNCLWLMGNWNTITFQMVQQKVKFTKHKQSAPSTTISKSPRYQKGKGLGAELANSKNLLYSISGKKSANNLAQVPSPMSYELKLPGSSNEKKKT